MKVSKKKVEGLISALENTVDLFGKYPGTKDYKRGYTFALRLCISGIKNEILNK